MQEKKHATREEGFYAFFPLSFFFLSLSSFFSRTERGTDFFPVPRALAATIMLASPVPDSRAWWLPNHTWLGVVDPALTSLDRSHDIKPLHVSSANRKGGAVLKGGWAADHPPPLRLPADRRWLSACKRELPPWPLLVPAVVAPSTTAVPCDAADDPETT